MNIGIYGGSFNPPHIAHLILAELLYEILQLDTLLFVPSAVPPHKQNDTLLDGDQRLKLMKCAVEGNDRLEVSDIEIKRGGTSYTIETLDTLERLYKNVTFYLIVGVDNLVTFHYWKDYKAILDRCRLIAMKRPGFDVSQVQSDVLEKVTIIDLPHLEISSTEIRRRIREGKSIRYMVPDAVFEEIKRSGFYI